MGFEGFSSFSLLLGLISSPGFFQQAPYTPAWRCFFQRILAFPAHPMMVPHATLFFSSLEQPISAGILTVCYFLLPPRWVLHLISILLRLTEHDEFPFFIFTPSFFDAP